MLEELFPGLFVALAERNEEVRWDFSRRHPLDKETKLWGGVTGAARIGAIRSDFSIGISDPYSFFNSRGGIPEEKTCYVFALAGAVLRFLE